MVAEFYARIFYRNAVNGGYIVPAETAERLCEKVCTGDELRINLEACIMENLTTGEKYSLRPLGEVVPILEAGGVFPYARSKGCCPPDRVWSHWSRGVIRWKLITTEA